MVVSVVVGFLYMSISSRWDFLMISRSRKLIWLLVSNFWGKTYVAVHGVGVVNYRLRVSAGGVINY